MKTLLYRGNRWGTQSRGKNNVEFKKREVKNMGGVPLKMSCGYCKNPTFKTRSQINQSKSGKVFCSNKCVGKYNAEQRANKKEYVCKMCKQKFSVVPSRKNVVACSRKCHSEWQSTHLIGEKANNFKGSLKEKNCTECNSLYKSRSKQSKFCSQKCKQANWSENILHKTETFIENHINGNAKARRKKLLINGSRSMTIPEKIIRDYLEEIDVEYTQEVRLAGRFITDFYIENSNLAIEVFGDYWHANPLKYGFGFENLNRNQMKKRVSDADRIRAFKDKGIRLIILWEHDIKSDLDACKRKIEKYI